MLFIFLTNCSATGSVFLGPIFTGATSGSVYQASLSYGGNKLISDLNSYKKINKFIDNQKKTTNEPIILASLAVEKIEISEVIEPEPLP